MVVAISEVTAVETLYSSHVSAAQLSHNSQRHSVAQTRSVCSTELGVSNAIEQQAGIAHCSQLKETNVMCWNLTYRDDSRMSSWILFVALCSCSYYTDTN
jgi:hypothetical protein